LIILGLFLIFTFGFAAYAAPNITASLTANPTAFSGKCPALITFNGQITASAPGRVQYKFIRSDNANAPVQTLNFEKAGTMAVSTTWTLGGAALPTYAGWEAIQVVYPQQVQSNKAEFKIQCAGGQDNPGGKKPDLGMYGFLKLGKNSKEVKWNETIVLTPADATLISGGKPAFEVYYAYREYDGTAVPGPFKNKIFFNDNLVSQQTNLACGAMEIKNVHTQAYLGPQDGKLQIKIDADDEVAESREDNNFHFYVNIKFEGFKTQAVAVARPQAGNIAQALVPVSEDCVGFNPATTEVKKLEEWKIVDGGHLMFGFGTNKAEADKALAIIKHYRMNESCFVGRPDPSFSYLKVGGAAPVGAFAGEDCLAFNPATIEVKQISGDWKIVDGSHWMFSFGAKKAEAEQSLAIIKKYGFTHTCYVGRPGPSFKYLRK
jgi:hypothetical protein